MSDAQPDMASDQGAALVSPSRETPGALLRAARERAGLHVAALAVSIKIPVKKLEALEADQLQATHDIVFTRALASSVCRALKVDPKPILDALPQSTVKDLHVDDNGINAPFASTSGNTGTSFLDVIKQPWAMLVVALGVGALAIVGFGWWEGREGGISAPAQAVAEEPLAPQVPMPVVIPAASPAPEIEKPVAMPEVSSSPVPVNVAQEQIKGSANTKIPDGVGASLTAGGSRESVGSSAVAADLIMSFKARQQSVWVEVIDARGDVRLRRNLGAGERVECGGVLPLSVVLGRADSVDVEVRGKPFSIAPFARENVARFEVK